MDTDTSWQVMDETNAIAIGLSLGIPIICIVGCCFYIHCKKYLEKKNYLKKKTELQELIVYNPLPIQPP